MRQVERECGGQIVLERGRSASEASESKRRRESIWDRLREVQDSRRSNKAG